MRSVVIRRDQLANIGLIAFYILLLLLKTRSFLGGRFWAEEGRVFFTSIYGMRPLGALVYVNARQSQYLLVTNIGVYLATLAPFQYAPLITTGFALAMQSVVVAILIAHKSALHLTNLALAVVIGIIVTLPQSSEVWANTANLHWHMQIILVLILIVPFTSRSSRYVLLALLLVAGLTGFSIVFLLPLFLVKSFHTRDADDFLRTAIAGAASLIQVSVLLSSPPGRAVGIRPLYALYGLATQQFLSPLVGGRIFQLSGVEKIAEVYRQYAVNPSLDGLPLLILTAAVVVLAYERTARRGNTITYYLLAGAILLVIGNLLGSLPPKEEVISTWRAGRYFYAPNVLFYIALATIRPKPNALKVYMAVVFFTGILINSSVPRSGMDWGAAYRRASALQLEQVEIWPHPLTIPNVELSEEGYELTEGTFESPTDVLAECRGNCIAALILRQDEESLAHTCAIAIMRDGETLHDRQCTSHGSVLMDADDEFEVIVRAARGAISVNGIVLVEGEDTSNVVIIDKHTRRIIFQSF